MPVAATAISFSFGSCFSVSLAHRHLVDDGDGRVLQPLDDLLGRPGRFVFFVAVLKFRLAHIGADRLAIEEHDLVLHRTNPLTPKRLLQCLKPNPSRLVRSASLKRRRRGPAKLVGEIGPDAPLSPRARESLFGCDLLDLRLHAVAEMRLRRRDATSELDLDAGIAHRHLCTGDRAEQHQLVQIAEMADTKQLARDLGQPGAEREIVASIGDVDHIGAVEARQAP